MTYSITEKVRHDFGAYSETYGSSEFNRRGGRIIVACKHPTDSEKSKQEISVIKRSEG